MNIVVLQITTSFVGSVKKECSIFIISEFKAMIAVATIIDQKRRVANFPTRKSIRIKAVEARPTGEYKPCQRAALEAVAPVENQHGSFFSMRQ
jgi:hypothetical protein